VKDPRPPREHYRGAARFAPAPRLSQGASFEEAPERRGRREW